MRKFFTGFFLSFIVTSVAMADVIVDGFVIDGSKIQSIDINPISGDVTINSNANNQITVTVTSVGSSVSIDTFSLTPSTVLINGTTTVNWSVTNATSCVASGGLDTWGGSVNASGGSQQINVGSTAGTFPFTLSCGDGGTPEVAQVNLTITADPVVSINSFSVTPSGIETGESVQVSWNVSNATSCTATGGTGTWGGSVNAGGGTQQVVINAAGNYSFGLNCSNASGSDTASDSVSVNNPTVGCDAPLLSGNTQTWSSIFGDAWPQTGSRTRDVLIPRAGYTALQFNTGNLQAFGHEITIEVTSNTGTRLGTISPCPGEFSAVPENCKESWGASRRLDWSTLTNPDSNQCALSPNTTYYLNLTFTNGRSSGSDTCGGTTSSTCKTRLQHTVR
jgi:hypothetical protein